MREGEKATRSTRLRGTQGGSHLSQLALRRLRSAPDHAPGFGQSAAWAALAGHAGCRPCFPQRHAPHVGRATGEQRLDEELQLLLQHAGPTHVAARARRAPAKTREGSNARDAPAILRAISAEHDDGTTEGVLEDVRQAVRSVGRVVAVARAGRHAARRVARPELAAREHADERYTRQHCLQPASLGVGLLVEAHATSVAGEDHTTRWLQAGLACPRGARGEVTKALRWYGAGATGAGAVVMVVALQAAMERHAEVVGAADLRARQTLVPQPSNLSRMAHASSGITSPAPGGRSAQARAMPPAAQPTGRGLPPPTSYPTPLKDRTTPWR
eukprot:scaffold16569_cov60-Phaeocystis_antarctica.AAC.2